MSKRKIERHKAGLPDVPEKVLNETELLAYQDLLKQIRRAGVEKHASVEILCVAAVQKALLDLLDEKIRALPTLVVETLHGSLSMHPYMRERRTLHTNYITTLGGLLLTPRSKSVARLKEDDNTGVTVEEDPILKLCQG